VTIDLDGLGGINPLIAAANPILSIVPWIRKQLRHPDPLQLREQLLQMIRKFEEIAGKAMVTSENIQIARYALCTLVDEAVAATPWGGASDWVSRNLLVTLHQERVGGEKFFQVLDRLGETPKDKVDLIELYYVCLSLGLEGRYRLLNDGRTQLDHLRERTAMLIRSVRGEPERDLSPRWRGEQVKTYKSNRFFMLWAAIAVSSLILIVLYAVLVFSLSGTTDDIGFSGLRLSLPQPAPVAVASAAPPVAPRLSKFLDAEIRAGQVAVRDEPQISMVSIVGDGLFDSGSVQVREQYEAVLSKVAAALQAVPGKVTVVGHTDDRPLRSLRFPSNWHLSQARAENVAHFIGQHLSEAGRVEAIGRGDSEPLVANDNDANRARNRRVEIILKLVD
jgi:type VI secretion system protein ImpK